MCDSGKKIMLIILRAYRDNILVIFIDIFVSVIYTH